MSIDSRFLCGADAGLLDAWLRDGLGQIARSPGLVSMWRGPAAQPAAATFMDSVATLAWAEPNFDRINVVVLQNDARQTDGDASPRELRGSASVQSVLPPLLSELFIRRGLLLVHSAVLSCPDGTGILVTAPGGGGKTTTALSVLRRGARLLADDLNALQTDGDRVHALGFPEMLNISRETMHFFPELLDAPSCTPEDSGSHKKVVSPLAVYGNDCMAESCELNVIYFVRIAPGRPEAVPVKGVDAFGMLMHAQTFANGQVPDAECFQRLSVILERVKAYELRTGDDPAALGEWLTLNCRAHA